MSVEFYHTTEMAADEMVCMMIAYRKRHPSHSFGPVHAKVVRRSSKHIQSWAEQLNTMVLNSRCHGKNHCNDPPASDCIHIGTCIAADNRTMRRASDRID